MLIVLQQCLLYYSNAYCTTARAPRLCSTTSMSLLLTHTAAAPDVCTLGMNDRFAAYGTRAGLVVLVDIHTGTVV